MPTRRAFLLPGLLALAAAAVARPPVVKDATPAELRAFFRHADKTVVTFVGYSGTGYEDPPGMLALAESILDEFDPARTIVNIGGTPEGIGSVYELAKRKGFATTGIVSSQAKREGATPSPFADDVFYVEDETWGGRIGDTDRLSPTSAAMVENSSLMIGIGGGEIARDELLAARRSGTPVRFFAADMNHEKAREVARKKQRPDPVDFRGAAAAAF